MLKKLDETEYVKYEPYQGVTLTRKGSALAEKMARKHRLLERFLHDVLHIGNEKVHSKPARWNMSFLTTPNAPCARPSKPHQDVPGGQQYYSCLQPGIYHLSRMPAMGRG